MTTLTLSTNQVSQITFVPAGSRITSTGNGSIEWTPGSPTDAANAANWQTWAKGSSAGYMDTLRPMSIRATATGSMRVTIEEGRGDKYGEDAYFDADYPTFATDSSGNVTGLVGPDGANLHIGARLVHCSTAPDTGLDVRADINAQLAALNPGELLYLRAGTYIVSKETSNNWCLLLQNNYTGIVGDGMGATIIKVSDAAGPGPCVVRGDSLTGAHLEGFTVDGNNSRAGAVESGAEAEGVNLKDSINARVINVEAVNCDADGFDMDDATEMVMIGCRAKNCWGNGYHFAGSSTHAVRCQIIACSSEGCGIKRALFDSFGEGISLAGTGSIINGFTSKMDRRGVSIDGDNNIVSNCTVIDAGDGVTSDVGIRTLTNAQRCLINSCMVLRTVTDATATAVTMTSGANCTIMNSVIRNHGTGINMQGTMLAANNRVISAGQQGIQTSGASSRCYIKGNLIDTAGHGIRIETVNAEIEGNTIVSTSSQGIDLRADGATVMHNRVVNGSAYGVRMFDANVDNAKVCFNVFNATSGGVSLAGTGHVVASNMINDVFTA